VHPLVAQSSGMTHDLLVAGCLFVEERAVLQVEPIHKAQLPNYQE
jgi:hypothetical protein